MSLSDSSTSDLPGRPFRVCTDSRNHNWVVNFGMILQRCFNKKRALVVIAPFGSGALVKTVGGRYKFCGGSPGDKQDAKEWVSLFKPEATFGNS